MNKKHKYISWRFLFPCHGALLLRTEMAVRRAVDIRQTMR
jgi:hypothetical protein